MIGRFLVGMLSGAVLVVGLFVLGSVVFPIAETPAATAKAAAGNEPPVAETTPPAQPAADTATAEPAVEAPSTDAPSETALAALPEAAPAVTEAIDPAPATDQATTEAEPTEDPAQTETQDPAAEETATVPALTVLDPGAVAAAVEPPATTPATEPAPETAVEPTPEPASDVPVEAAAEPAPAEVAEVLPADQPPAADAAPEPAPDAMPAPEPGTTPETLPEPEVASLPEAGDAASPDSTFKPAPGLEGTDGVIVGRLPNVETTPDAVAAAPAETAPIDDRPLARFAAPFENPDGKPLLSVVLIDPGTEDLDREGLAALALPVAIALDPLDPATATRAALYRAAGKEVVMLATGIADGAQASDIEVAFQSMEQGLPEAVAVMDLAQAAFQSSRPLASLVVPVVGAQGRGLLTWDQGLNAADQVARRDDIPAAVIFRDFATGGTDRGAIRRLLDRAVFKAGQDGRVVLAGTASADLVAALLEWTVEGRAATVAFAPVSAVLTVE